MQPLFTWTRYTVRARPRCLVTETLLVLLVDLFNSHQIGRRTYALAFQVLALQEGV